MKIEHVPIIWTKWQNCQNVLSWKNFKVFSYHLQSDRTGIDRWNMWKVNAHTDSVSTLKILDYKSKQYNWKPWGINLILVENLEHVNENSTIESPEE